MHRLLLLALVSGASAAAAPPTPPENVHHTETCPAHVRVEWADTAADEAGYRIWRREAGGAWYLAGETGPNTTRFDDGGMQELSAYEHKVAAFNASGEGMAMTTPGAVKTLRMQAHLKPEVIFPADGVNFSKDPGVVALKTGELLLAYEVADTATRKSHAEESLWLVTSRDQRNAWSSPRLLLRGDREVIYGKPALIRMSDGRLGMTFSRWVCDEKGKIIGRARQFIASSDEGASWSQPVDVGPLSANNQTLVLAQGGRLVESLSDTTGVNKVFVSDDQGATWQLSGQVPGKRLGEAALAHLGAGRLVFLSRHEWPFYRLSFSEDNGKTWDNKPSLLYLGGGDNPPKLALLPDGKTLAAIVHSWYPGRKAKDRRQLASLISRDGGRTWDNFRLIGFSPDGTDGFLQHAVTFVGDTAYLFYGGGSRLDTNDGKDLRLLRLHQSFFTSTTPWPYDWRGEALARDPSPGPGADVPSVQPKSVPASRPALTPEEVTAVRFMNEQNPAIPAPRIVNLNGEIQAAFLRAHNMFFARGKKGPIGVLFLGDSITAGWHARGTDVWKERFENDKYQPANFGISGNKTQHVLWRIANGELDGIHPKVLVLMIGTNNGEKPADDIAQGVTAIVNAIREKLPATKILLHGIFPRGEKPDDPIRAKLKAVNETISRLDDAQHIFYLDIGGRFLQPDGSISRSVFVDFTHPSAEGYKIWADAMQPKLDELMK